MSEQTTELKHYSFHMQIDLQGALKNFDPEMWEGVASDDGKPMTADEAKAWLQSEIDKGHVVYPVCHPDKCPDFDYFGGGCPKHPIEPLPPLHPCYCGSEKCNQEIALANESETWNVIDSLWTDADEDAPSRQLFFVSALCGARGPLADTEEEAVRLWNTRPVEAALQKRIEELEAEVDRFSRANEAMHAQRGELIGRIEELKAERRWIPVSERYPGDEAFNRTGVVEIYSKRFGILTAWYERWDSTWVTNLENHRLPSLQRDVTHWRPIGAPPTD